MTLSRNTPRGDRMPATLSAAFTTAMRMVHRVHGSAAHSGTNAQPALSPCLAIRAQRVFLIADLADGRSAVAQDTPHFTGAQPQGCIARSEEHTSELQSRENLVCRLLLEKKNKSHP